MLIISIIAIVCVVVFNVSYWLVLPVFISSAPVATDSFDPAMAASSETVISSARLLWAGIIVVATAVVGIICWLGLNGMQSRARVTRNKQRRNDLHLLQKGMLEFYRKNGRYPVGADTDRAVPATDLGRGWEGFGYPHAEEMRTYIPNWPVVDPLVSASERDQVNQYLYLPLTQGQSYALYAHMELEKDQDLPSFSQTDGLPSAWGDYNYKVGPLNLEQSPNPTYTSAVDENSQSLPQTS